MPSKYCPPLHTLMYKGRSSGLLWTTQGRDQFDGKQNRQIKVCSNLHQHPHQFHISKAISKGLKTVKPYVVDRALADLYNEARENIGLCDKFEPEEFFALAKDSFVWSAKLADKAFWAFTYKAFHARALFLHAYPDFHAHTRHNEEEPTARALAVALDLFREKFLETWPIEHTKAADKISQEEIERVEDVVSINRKIYDKYFPHNFTHYNGDGDGTDKVIPVRDYHSAAKPFNLKELKKAIAKISDEELCHYDTVKGKHREAFAEALGKNAKSEAEYRNSTTQKREEGRGIVRDYNAFLNYRDPNAEAGADEPDNGNEAGAAQDGPEYVDDGDDMMEEVGEEVPDVKRLKLEE
ncbi:hypothetical protein GGR54DRAFT_643256 [Hypoxylon sp. NC1633]|nr:hypothetical protein GGR54DRAFT_643256 [Hypoxylon sp. NC1633]